MLKHNLIEGTNAAKTIVVLPSERELEIESRVYRRMLFQDRGRWYDEPLRHSIVVTMEVVNPPVPLMCSAYLREGLDFHQILPRQTLQ